MRLIVLKAAMTRPTLSGFFQKTGLEHDGGLSLAALDLFAVRGEMDVLEDLSPLEVQRRTLHLQVLGELHRVAFSEGVAV